MRSSAWFVASVCAAFFADACPVRADAGPSINFPSGYAPGQGAMRQAVRWKLSSSQRGGSDPDCGKARESRSWPSRTPLP